MTKIFNSTFEVSLRILSLLSTVATTDMNVDRITAYDFITIYSKYFELSDVNLHGDNNFGFSEFSARREVVQEATKRLVLDGLIRAIRHKNGFCYVLTDRGGQFCVVQNNEYVVDYCTLATKTHQHYKNMTDVEILTEISQKSTNFLRRCNNG